MNADFKLWAGGMFNNELADSLVLGKHTRGSGEEEGLKLNPSPLVQCWICDCSKLKCAKNW